MTHKVHVVHGDPPKRPKKDDNLSLTLYNMARMNYIKSKIPKITDRLLSQKLGISFNQLQDLKKFVATQEHIERGLSQ